MQRLRIMHDTEGMQKMQNYKYEKLAKIAKMQRMEGTQSMQQTPTLQRMQKLQIYQTKKMQRFNFFQCTLSKVKRVKNRNTKCQFNIAESPLQFYTSMTETAPNFIYVWKFIINWISIIFQASVKQYLWLCLHFLPKIYGKN